MSTINWIPPNAPQRIMLSRKKGFNLQRASQELNGLDAVNCARPGRWGNPFVVGEHVKDAAGACRKFRALLKARKTPGLSLADIRVELGGKNLACWCKFGEPCHCNVLLMIANGAQDFGDI